MVEDPGECSVTGALLLVDRGMTARGAVCEAGRRVSDKHWPAPRKITAHTSHIADIPAGACCYNRAAKVIVHQADAQAYPGAAC